MLHYYNSSCAEHICNMMETMIKHLENSSEVPSTIQHIDDPDIYITLR